MRSILQKPSVSDPLQRIPPFDIGVFLGHPVLSFDPNPRAGHGEPLSVRFVSPIRSTFRNVPVTLLAYVANPFALAQGMRKTLRCPRRFRYRLLKPLAARGKSRCCAWRYVSG